MAETKLNYSIERLEQKYLPQFKEQTKYILSLATGTLIFSITFIEKIVPYPIHKWLIVSGWVSLLFSIISGVLSISLFYSLIQQIEVLSSLGKGDTLKILLEAFKDKKFFDRLIVKYMLDKLPSNDAEKTEEEKQAQEAKIDALLKDDKSFDMLKEKLIEIYGEYSEIVKEGLKVFSLIQRVLPLVHPVRVIRRLRRLLIMVKLLPYVTLWLFLIGTVLITIFGILNFV